MQCINFFQQEDSNGDVCETFSSDKEIFYFSNYSTKSK